MPTLTIKYESNISDIKSNSCADTTFTLDFQCEQITVEELIRSHVYQSVKERTAKKSQQPKPHSTIQPSLEEIALNGVRKEAAIDWQAEFEKTKEAFRKRQIFVLVDGKQMSSLQDTINIAASTDVRFLRLTFLVGG